MSFHYHLFPTNNVVIFELLKPIEDHFPGHAKNGNRIYKNDFLFIYIILFAFP